MDCFPHSRCLACAPDDHWELPRFPSPPTLNLRNNQRLLSLRAVPPRLFLPYCVIFLADTPGRFLPRDNREDLRQCLSFCFPAQEAETRGIYIQRPAHSANVLTCMTISWRCTELVLAFREVEVSQEVRSLSAGRARGLQLENGCSERDNPRGFEWDLARSGCNTHTHTYMSACFRPVYRHKHKSVWQTQKSLNIDLKRSVLVLSKPGRTL